MYNQHRCKQAVRVIVWMSSKFWKFALSCTTHVFFARCRLGSCASMGLEVVWTYTHCHLILDTPSSPWETSQTSTTSNYQTGPRASKENHANVRARSSLARQHGLPGTAERPVSETGLPGVPTLSRSQLLLRFGVLPDEEEALRARAKAWDRSATPKLAGLGPRPAVCRVPVSGGSR